MQMIQDMQDNPYDSPKTAPCSGNTDIDHVKEEKSIHTNETDAEVVSKPLSSYFNVIFSGVALFSDGYQAGVISFINLCLGILYGPTVFNDTMTSRLSYALFVGAILGQLGFGLIIDRIGRKAGLVGTTVFVILGAALSCASNGKTPTDLLWMMIVSRGVLGFGVGGEYPCSSVSAGESADEIAPHRRGMLFVFVTNFVIDIGFVFSALVPVILLAIFGDHLEPVWRLSFGFGIIPPLSVLYFRIKMADSKRYQVGAMRRRVPYWLIFRRYWRRILLTSGTWFVYDFIAYPSTIFTSVIVNAVSTGKPTIVTVAWTMLLFAFYVPGSAIGATLVDKIGRRKTMVLGLFCQGTIGLFMGGFYHTLSSAYFPLFIVLYGLFLAFGEFAGNCMGLNAMELFPTAVRGTGYGIAAALGKVGATVGTLAFLPMETAMGGTRGPFLVSSGIGIATGIVIWFLLPDIGPEGLVEEDEAFKAYLVSHGHDVTNMGTRGGNAT